jgi:hypothetical protein
MKVNKEQLQRAMEIVRPGLASKEYIEQTTSFLFKGGRVITYNDEISISHPVEDLSIDGAIKAEELYKFLSKISKEEIDVSATEKEIQLKAGRIKAGLTLQKEIKIPFEDEIGEIGKWKKLPEGFNKSARFAMSSCSRDMSNPALTCVHITPDGIVEGTDSFRIAQCENDKIPVKESLVPADSIKEVIKIEPTHVAEGDGWIHFSNEEGTVASSRLYVSEYKDLSPFMDVDGVEFEFPESILESIERAYVFAKKENILDEWLQIDISKNKLQISGQSETGWAKEKHSIKYDGDHIRFMVVPYLLQDILKETRRCTIGDNKMKFSDSNWSYVSVLRKVEE